MQESTRNLLRGQRELGVDYETTGLNVFTCRILGLALANLDGGFAFIRDKREIVEVVEYMNEHGITAIMYNARYDMGVSKAKAVPAFKDFVDVYAAVKLYDERWPRYKLNNAAANILADPFYLEYKDEFKEYLKAKYGRSASFESVQDEEDFAKLTEYACTDALATILIWQQVKPKLDAMGLLGLLDLEHQVIRVLVDVHHDGIQVDREYLKQAENTLSRLLIKLEAMAKEYTKDYTEPVEHGEARFECYARLADTGLSKSEMWKQRKTWTTEEYVEVNIASGSQLGKVFKKLYGISSPLRTPKGQESWSSEALAAIDHPLADVVNHHRSMTKLLTAFVRPWLEKSEHDGRLHPEIDNIAATTGRMSSREPNIQQVPKFGTSVDLDDLVWVNQAAKDNPELYKAMTSSDRKADSAISVLTKSAEHQINIRKALTADDENHTLICMDYSQMEVVLFAHLCKDPVLVEALTNGEDVHAEMARQLFPEAATLDADNEKFKVYRKLAKSVIFGLLYGIGPRTLSIQIGQTEAEAKSLMKQWFRKFPRTKMFMDDCFEQVEQQGFVTTIFNRRRRLTFREAYKAPNAVIQGSCADIMKGALVDIHNQLWPDVQIRFVVHDEVVAQVPVERAEEIALKMERIMCNQLETVPPLRVDWGMGFQYSK